MATYEAWRAQRKQFGPDWRCGECGLAFPAAGYGVDRHDATEFHKTCVGPGHWRCCTACAQVRGKLDDTPGATAAPRMCP